MPPLGIAVLIFAFTMVDLALWSTGANLQNPFGTGLLGVFLGQLALIAMWITPGGSMPVGKMSVLQKATIMLTIVIGMGWLLSSNDPRYDWAHVTAMLGIYSGFIMGLRAFLVESLWEKLRFHLKDVLGWSTIFALWLAWSRTALADDAIFDTMSFAISAGLAGLGWAAVLESSSTNGRALYHSACGLAASNLLIQSFIWDDHRLMTAAITQGLILSAGVAIVRIYEPREHVERPSASSIRPLV
jgi:hypothetical protein